MPVRGDNPIRSPEEDVLGRVRIANNFADEVLSLDPTEGLVVGVLGPWGSGKTSFLNLVRLELAKAGIAILDFNPWMFSGAEQLVDSFFIELASQLKIRPGLDKIGEGLEEYGEVFSGISWLPVVGPWIERVRGAAKILAKILQRRREGVSSRRTKLEKALADLEKPIVVVLDDIDRLSTLEIRDVFRLIRLIASFPNIIYIVAFDRVRVEGALAEAGVPGRDYLEKILGTALDLPRIPDQVLSREVLSALDAALTGLDNPGPFDEQVWPDVFMEIIRPLIRNMRDVRRYAAAIRGTVRGLEGQVALADLLALEAIRVFLPSVFAQLHRAVHGLTGTSEPAYGRSGEPPELKAQVNRLIEAAESHDGVVRAMIERLFPAAHRHIGGSHYGADWKGPWLRERRVAHEDILRLFLEHVAGEGLRAFTDAERAWALMTDREALEVFLRSLDAERLQDVISRLELYEDQYASDHVVPGTIVLLNLLPDLPERRGGMFELDARLVVGRVTYRLLRKLGGPDEVEAALRQIFPELKTFSAKLKLIEDVGYREDVGHKLVSQAAASEFVRDWRKEVRSASAQDLAREKDLLRVLLVARRETEASEEPPPVDNAPELTLALVRAAQGEVRTQPMGSRRVRRSLRLAWDALVEVFGDEATLKERIEALKAAGPPEEDKDLLELADKYLTGWRPRDFDDE